MTESQLDDLGTRYAAAWSSQEPLQLAAFYTDNGSLGVNAGAPAIGRAAITEKAKAFMTAFPDMVVRMDSMADGTTIPVSTGPGPAPTPGQGARGTPSASWATRIGRLRPTD